MTGIHALLVAVAVLAAACAPVGPNYERPSYDLPRAYPGAAATPDAPVRLDWWTLYGDTRLNELIASALERNSDVRLAVARIEEADANLREANQFTLFGRRMILYQRREIPFP